MSLSIVPTKDTREDTREIYDPTYDLRKAPRSKFVKGVYVRSGRSVRFTGVHSTKVFANEGVTDRGYFYVYSYQNNHSYSDKSKEYMRGHACCGSSHICLHLVNQVLSRRGRSWKIGKEDLDLNMD